MRDEVVIGFGSQTGSAEATSGAEGVKRPHLVLRGEIRGLVDEALEDQGAESLRNGSKGLRCARGLRMGLISCTGGLRSRGLQEA